MEYHDRISSALSTPGLYAIATSVRLKKMAPARYALIVATSEYGDTRLGSLRASVADAHALGKVIRDPAIGDYALQSQINRPAHNLNEAIEDFFQGRKREDQLLLYFSCHGVRNDSGRLYFAAPNTKTTRLGSTAVSSEFVAEQLFECRARRIIVLLDCCYSGAFTRGFVSRAGDSVDLGGLAGSGRAVLCASSAMEYAFEVDGGEFEGVGQPSAFTRAIVHGLRTGLADLDGDGEVSVEELYDHVLGQVRQITPHQTPNKFIGTEGTIYIAHSVRAIFGLGALRKEIRDALSSPLVGVRKGVIDELVPLLQSASDQIREAARAALLGLRNDESDRVVQAAASALGYGENLLPVIPPGGTPAATSQDHPYAALHAPPGESSKRASEIPHPRDGRIRGLHSRDSAAAGKNVPQRETGRPFKSRKEIADWVDGIRFSTTRFGPGYDEEEVDSFLDKIRDTVLGTRTPPLTADEIRNAQFKQVRHGPGYDEEEVDGFLDQAELILSAALQTTGTG